MKWKARRKSKNVDDRRGRSTGGKIAAGGGVIAVLFLVIQFFTDGDISAITNQLQDQLPASTEERELTPEEKELGDFTATVLADTEDVWHEVFAAHNTHYREPGMVLFSDAVRADCGGAFSASCPFYCPAHEKLYMDLRFFNELQTRFGAEGGDFAMAYVIAHEVGHHIQTLLGTSRKTRQLQQEINETEANRLSVALELQADYYAGVWAHHNNEYLERGDIMEAMSAASAVGDDAIQKRTSGRVVPDAFTHGTSEQRMSWFQKGFNPEIERKEILFQKY
ncbi:metalloprotease [Salinimicrobium marinum]|uniref:Metalloprotease n=1 Tax=Salinimicrobium marinum TaxID=680283 RepID=A0A918S914_9FLAO|nr:metalloprotease [Salinimicrobium marinum]